MVKINLDLNVFLISVLAFLPRCHSMEIPASCLIVILSIQSWKPIISLMSFIWLSSLTAKRMPEMNEVIIHKLWYRRVRIWASLYTWFFCNRINCFFKLVIQIHSYYYYHHRYRNYFYGIWLLSSWNFWLTTWVLPI